MILARALALAFTLTAWAPLLSQEPPGSDMSPTPPKATLDDVAWLIGDWEGRDSEGDRVVERWLAPIGVVMIGTFVQTNQDPTGDEQVDWSEHNLLREEGGSLIMTSVSVQSGFESELPISYQKPLLSIEPCSITFEDLDIRCSDRRNPGSGLVVTYGQDFLGDGTGVYSIRYKKAGDE